jgi:hypothetical protein
MESRNPTLYPLFPRVFGAELAFFVFFSPPLLILWIFAAYYYHISGAVSGPIVKVALYYTATFALAVLAYGNAKAIRKTKGVVLDGERIVKKGVVRGASLEYSEVTGVLCTRNPLFNRRMILKLAKGGFSLPLNISDGHKMVEAVFERLAALGPTGWDVKKTADTKRRLYATALRYNALYGLRGLYMRNFIKAAAAAAIFYGTVAAAFWERDLVTALSWGLAGMMFQTLAYLAAEKIWMLTLPVTRDTVEINAGMIEAFKTTHAISALTALLAGMVIGISFTFPA